MSDDQGASARAVVDSNSYMTLGTADESGRPWVSPVWFAHSGYREFFWVSSPEAQHSRNLEARPEVSIVIFDSQVPPSEAAAVYVSARAEQLSGDELDSGIEVFSEKSVSDGLPAYSPGDVQEPASLRLYRAVATSTSLSASAANESRSTRPRARARAVGSPDRGAANRRRAFSVHRVSPGSEERST